MRQMLEHPSPGVVLPSSQVSMPLTTPSPQAGPPESPTDASPPPDEQSSLPSYPQVQAPDDDAHEYVKRHALQTAPVIAVDGLGHPGGHVTELSGSVEPSVAPPSVIPP